MEPLLCFTHHLSLTFLVQSSLKRHLSSTSDIILGFLHSGGYEDQRSTQSFFLLPYATAVVVYPHRGKYRVLRCECQHNTAKRPF